MISELLANRVRRTYLGGGRIDAFTENAQPDDGYLRPEDWLASTTTAFNGTVEIDGEGLGRLADGRLVKDIVGTIPILVKLLDSDERLVIQAHPTVEYAKAKFNSPFGKTECWYFLPGTAPDACVYLGFKPGITKEKWQKAFKTQSGLLDCLHRIPVTPGDFVFVDGGIPHAIGAGCFIIELQEPSDLMVVAEKFTPSGREIVDKKIHCGLGLKEMFNVYDYTGYTFDGIMAKYVKHPDDTARAVRILGPELTDKFEMWRLSQGADLALRGLTAIVIVTGGNGDINGTTVHKGSCLVAVNEETLRIHGDMTTVVCFKRDTH